MTPEQATLAIERFSATCAGHVMQLHGGPQVVLVDKHGLLGGVGFRLR